jgi:hypothetical protein
MRGIRTQANADEAHMEQQAIARRLHAEHDPYELKLIKCLRIALRQPVIDLDLVKAISAELARINDVEDQWHAEALRLAQGAPARG